MNGRRPSLRAFHAFVLVARHGSNVAAGAELGISASAVSHLLRELERQVGMILLERDGGRRQLTADGVALAAEILPAFDTIVGAAERVKSGTDVVRLTTVNSFADLWLAPRLGRLRQAEPSLDLQIATTTRVVDLDREDADFAIRWGEGNWSGVVSDLLFHERLIAVAHPRLASSLDELIQGGTLPRLIARRRNEDWDLWATAAGVPAEDHAGPTIEAETRSLAVQIAIAGAGVLAIDEHLVRHELERGRLICVRPNIKVERQGGYWLARRAGRGMSRAAQRVRSFVLDESSDCAG